MNEDMDKLIAERATEMSLRFDAGTPEEQAEVVAWLKQSRRHVRAFLDAYAERAEIDRRIGAGTRMQFTADARPAESSDAYDRRDTSPAARTAHLAPPKRLTTGKRARRILAAAATVLVALGAVIFIARLQSASDLEISTRAGEWRTRLLDDGTIVQAGPRTRLRIEFTEARRDVRLLHGEASFRVVKDAERPFLVETGLATVRAVGTEFALNLYDTAQLRVAVKEGVVEVARRAHSGIRRTISKAPGQTVRVKAGEQVHVTAEGPLASEQADLEAALAWATGRLIFRRETVEQAVREFNDRNELQIKVSDPALLQRPVRGTFSATNPRSFAAQLKAQLKAQGALTVNEASGTLLIAPDKDAARRNASSASE